ncbi:hypothetical protein F7725_023671 [Dissostichus mawsoni]|uniref:Uncharacterized protein n=1 Tax=Dissostichus mawsoni TaxID=36200 RepID=A0A7J5XX73_DISMA|nr:hypothetical protein F7725_023661 [Dissostichus mawsoni]KAF3841720.1 hypothetical protein F7725_023671 [Dissostichus mawsoni]
MNTNVQDTHSFTYSHVFHLFRLRRELEMHEEGELELLREAPRSEIHVLKSQKLDSSQESKPR